MKIICLCLGVFNAIMALYEKAQELPHHTDHVVIAQVWFVALVIIVAIHAPQEEP